MRRERVAEPSQFGRRQEALATPLRVFLDMAARVGALGPETPLFGNVEQGGQASKRPVGFRRRIAARLMQPLDIPTRDVGNLAAADRWQDNVFQKAPVFSCG